MRRSDRQRETTSEHMDPPRRVRDLAFLIAGLGLGSGIALLLAPNNGEEIRHTIGRNYRKTVKSINRHTDDLRERADDLMEHAHELRDHGSKLLHWFQGGGQRLRRSA
ncbi:MAG TPA: YtxH domain-containing protein [Terriglobales bacterium]|nr:YtxH domain-containing protein [Terriglobales bacterium]